MAPPSKICPRCQRVAPLNAAVCQNCAHGFRTQFTPPLDRTQQVPALYPMATRSRTSPLGIALTVIGGLFALMIVLVMIGAILTNPEKNRPGHIVRLGEAETLTPLCSEHQVLETLGAPAQNVGDIWTYPAEGGNVVGVKFVTDGSLREVQAIVITDASGAVIWQKI